MMYFVLRKCTQINLLEAAVKGGNIFPLLGTGIRKSFKHDITNIVRIAQCITPKEKHLTPKVKFIANSNVHLSIQGFTPYSHPIALQSILQYSLKILFSTYCNQNTAELSHYHTIVGKGFFFLFTKFLRI